MAMRTLGGESRWPSMYTSPRTTGRRPAVARASSICPLPSTPATATISPERTWRSTPRTARMLGRLDDRDPLAIADRQVLDAGAGIDGEAELGRERRDPRFRPLAVEPEKRLAALVEDEVLGHGQAGSEREVLVDHADAE